MYMQQTQGEKSVSHQKKKIKKNCHLPTIPILETIQRHPDSMACVSPVYPLSWSMYKTKVPSELKTPVLAGN